MSPLRHLIVSLVLFAALFNYFGWASLLVFVSGVLIDIDHFFWYAAKKGDFSILRCHYFFKDVMAMKKQNEVQNALFVFHTLEFLFVLAVLSFFTKFALLLLIGYIFHVIPDVYFEVREWREKVIAFSVLWWFSR